MVCVRVGRAGGVWQGGQGRWCVARHGIWQVVCGRVSSATLFPCRPWCGVGLPHTHCCMARHMTPTPNMPPPPPPADVMASMARRVVGHTSSLGEDGGGFGVRGRGMGAGMPSMFPGTGMGAGIPSMFSGAGMGMPGLLGMGMGMGMPGPLGMGMGMGIPGPLGMGMGMPGPLGMGMGMPGPLGAAGEGRNLYPGS